VIRSLGGAHGFPSDEFRVGSRASRRINPQHFKFGLSVEQKKYDLAQFLRERIKTAPDLNALMEQVEPPFGGYRRTEQTLARYLELARTDDWEKLPDVQKPIDPGHPYSGVPRLARFLRLVGDPPADASVTADSETYDGALVDGVKRFQRRHGLDDDGRLGPATIRQLNVPLNDRVRQLQLTLERWRWLPTEFSAPPIIVNIPDFRLRALDENNKIAMEMRVVVGKAMRTQTPIFSRDMTYVVLRPYWNVPPSILRSEIIPAIQRDRGYLAPRRYEVATYDGKVVTSGDVSDEVLAQLRAGKLSSRAYRSSSSMGRRSPTKTAMSISARISTGTMRAWRQRWPGALSVRLARCSLICPQLTISPRAFSAQN